MRFIQVARLQEFPRNVQEHPRIRCHSEAGDLPLRHRDEGPSACG
jgi:hypothetical protein